MATNALRSKCQVGQKKEVLFILQIGFNIGSKFNQQRQSRLRRTVMCGVLIQRQYVVLITIKFPYTWEEGGYCHSKRYCEPTFLFIKSCIILKANMSGRRLIISLQFSCRRNNLYLIRNNANVLHKQLIIVWGRRQDN